MGKSLLKLLTIIRLVLAAFLLSSCSATNIAKDTNIDSSKGILITKFHSNSDNFDVYIERVPKDVFKVLILRDRKTETYIDKNPNNISNHGKHKVRVIKELLKVVPLKNGKAYFSQIVIHGDNRLKLEPYYFNLKPGIITYIGDLHINFVFSRKGSYAEVRMIDNESETIAEAKAKYPLIFNDFKYEKNIIEMPPDQRYPINVPHHIYVPM